MHIEPGALNAAKVLYGHAAAIATLLVYAPRWIGRLDQIAKTLLAAVFFSLFMQAYHVPAGVSELHFIGASAIYFVFGFLPTLFGFALGLLLQGLVFDPQDLVHLGVNALSLMLPLIAAHGLFGRRLFDSQSRRLDWQSVVRFDAVYYGGVVAMVGFWLSIGEEPLALDNWLLFAAAYAPLVLCEPLFTCLVVRLLKRWPDSAVLQRLTCVGNLRVA
ncbi:energy-coupling factor ABC transporter permease [Pseudomonas stutzeri]|nr:energy-coupling factor ABC transporter permease [Stutzerimonas stutzeri]